MQDAEEADLHTQMFLSAAISSSVLALASNNRVKRTRLFCQISGTSAWITSHPTSLAGAGHESRAWLPTRSHLAQHTDMFRYGRLWKPQCRHHFSDRMLSPIHQRVDDLASAARQSR
jgi:hypothetical protein